MIVSYEFPGGSREVARAQHDVYFEALQIIVKGCNRYARFAKLVLKTNEFENWGNVWEFDHRVLQFHHDLIATAWRYKSNAAQRILEFSEFSPGLKSRWLNWLREEVDRWIDHPEFVRLVMTILDNQNSPIGNAAEADLITELVYYFEDVPWRAQIKKINEKNESDVS